MIETKINRIINEYTTLLKIELISSEKHYVITGGNMTINRYNDELKLTSEIYPTTYDESTCDRYIKSYSNDLIALHKESYEKWLQRKLLAYNKLK